MDPLAPKIDADFYAITDVGSVRRANEDNFLVADLQRQRRSPDRTGACWRVGGRGLLFAVCDGMGGAAAGEVASQLAVDTINEHLLDLEPGLDPQSFAETLDRAIQIANATIFEMAQKDPSKQGMGTTISAAAAYGNVLFLAQVGDSRAYLLRQNQIIRVTKDQSLVEHLLEQGAITPEQAENFIGRNVILQALGPTPHVLVDLKYIPLEQGDTLLLCSDGLHGPVSDEEMLEIVTGQQDLSLAGQALIDLANKHGGPDNITAILARFTGPDLADPNSTGEPVPQPVTYIRAPVDLITLRMEKELGFAHWFNKHMLSRPLLVLYTLLLIFGLGYFFWSYGPALLKMFTTKAPKIRPPSESGRLVVASDVPTARLFVDGMPAGTLRKGGLSLVLPVGTYRIQLRYSGWVSPKSTVRVQGKKTILVELNRNSGSSAPNSRRVRPHAPRRILLPGRDPVPPSR